MNQLKQGDFHFVQNSCSHLFESSLIFLGVNLRHITQTPSITHLRSALVKQTDSSLKSRCIKPGTPWQGLLLQQLRELESKIGCNLSLAGWANPKIYVNHSVPLPLFILFKSKIHEDLFSPQSSSSSVMWRERIISWEKKIFFRAFFFF